MIKHSIIFLIGLFIVGLAACSDPSFSEPEPQPTQIANDVPLVPATIHEAGWSIPEKLGFNDAGWEDSPYITRDGSQILFFYHPWPSLADPTIAEELTEYIISNPQEAIDEGLDGKIFISNSPFTDKAIHPVSQSKEYPSAEACPYISESGDMFYTSTKDSFVQGEGVPATAYRNGERLDFGTGEEESNPHYCEALDEMWFDCPGDTNICLMKEAMKSGFSGEVNLAPYPINSNDSDVTDFQPFLTDDCQTLYFSSTRQESGLIAIYKTMRNEDSWSEPELFISHPAGVAELSMTSDGREMIFAQLFWREDGSPGIDIWYSQYEN